MTEQMRRELVIATTIARAQGVDYGTATDEQKAACHKLARVVLPGVNNLVDNERINVQDEMSEQIVGTHNKASRKAYEDGFEDGQRNHYQNRWVDQEDQTWSMEDLQHQG